MSACLTTIIVQLPKPLGLWHSFLPSCTKLIFIRTNISFFCGINFCLPYFYFLVINTRVDALNDKHYLKVYSCMAFIVGVIKPWKINKICSGLSMRSAVAFISLRLSYTICSYTTNFTGIQPYHWFWLLGTCAYKNSDECCLQSI